MKIRHNDPAREFLVNGKIRKDCASIELEEDEQVTFVHAGREVDFAATWFGYYATPSINSRLIAFGYRTALVLNAQRRLYVNLVREESVEAFTQFLKQKQAVLLCWLDDWSKDHL